MKYPKSPALLVATTALFLTLSGFGQVPSPSPTPDDTSAIRTPPARLRPRINGPRIYGARPGHPFFYHLPVTGQRPITITALGLPEGLTLDSATGNITGTVSKPGDYDVIFNAIGGLKNPNFDRATVRFVIGPNICLTPPMGWNSWNCFRVNIDEQKIRGAADAMVATGLIDHGWTYINMDDRWEGQRDGAGNIHSSAKIPDMKGLADYVHGKGLKVGLYSSPGPQTCAGAMGSWQHEDADVATYAGWGMDYLKYDLCSYPNVEDAAREEFYAEILPPAEASELRELATENATLSMQKYHPNPEYLPQTAADKQAAAAALESTKNRIAERMEALHNEARKLAPEKVAAIDMEVNKEPYRKMRGSLDKVDRDIVFSFCQYGIGKVWEWGAETGGNLWRTTGDIGANWKSVENHGFNQNGLEKWAGPGHWNDPDMLEVGNGNLTPDENYTHMTLWCMLSAPLLIGCDMPKMSPFIVSLFSNDEVLAVNQDALGRQGWRARQDGKTEVWMKPLADRCVAVAFFNRGEAAADVSVRWGDLKLIGRQSVRDLWRQKEMGVKDGGYSVNVAAHGAELFRVRAEKWVEGDF